MYELILSDEEKKEMEANDAIMLQKSVAHCAIVRITHRRY